MMQTTNYHHTCHFIIPGSVSTLSFLVLSSTAGGEEAARVPKMASISSKKGHEFLPWPLTRLQSLACSIHDNINHAIKTYRIYLTFLYLCVRFLILVRHCCHIREYPISSSCVAMFSNMVRFLATMSSWLWTFSCPQTLISARVSSALQPAAIASPRLANVQYLQMALDTCSSCEKRACSQLTGR